MMYTRLVFGLVVYSGKCVFFYVFYSLVRLSLFGRCADGFDMQIRQRYCAELSN